MSKPFNKLRGRRELRERLLRAGVAPRHVRRYLTELADHLADLAAQEERTGRSRADAESAALVRLGRTDDLAKAMIDQRQCQSWCARAPWAIFGLAPLLLLTGTWFVALSILWSGWRIFLPESDTPFVRIYGLAIFYFGVGRLLYYGAPILIGWGIGFIAARQRLKPVWPTAGLLPLALLAITAKVQASRTFPGGIGHVGLSFAVGSSAQGLFHTLLVLLNMLVIMILPPLIWRSRQVKDTGDLPYN